METLEERLRRELQRLSPLGDPSGVVDQVLRRGARRHAAHRLGTVMLTVGVIVGSLAGVYGLSRVFREGAPREPAAPGPSNGVIVFSRHIAGEGEQLFAATADGSDVRRLTPDGQAVYRSADVSPDGRTVVVAHEIPSFGFGQAVLATVPIEGGSPTWLSDEPWVVRDLAFSPDGGRLAFAGSPGGPFGIYVFDLETGDVRLVPGTDGISVGHPTWSPDGTRIGFEGSTGGGQDPAPWDIYTVAVDGSGMTNLTNTPDVSEIQPAWSWTLDRISFVEGGPAEGALRTMSSTGADAKTAYSGEFAPANPVWAPDGLAIAFEAGSEGIFIVGSDGAPLVIPNIQGTEPAWQTLPESEEVSPQPSPSPTPTESPSADVGEDIGLGFPVCFSERLGGIDYLGDGTNGAAWTAVPAKDDGTCPRYPDPERFIVAVDYTGDRVADSWVEFDYGCYNGCAPWGATDLDANGTEELIVGTYFSIMDYHFFAVGPGPNGDLRLEPILVADPGHEPARILVGEPLRIDAGGDAGYGSSIDCEGYPVAPVIVWSWIDGPVEGNQPLEVHVTRIELQTDGLFHVIDTNDSTVPAGTPFSIPQGSELGRPACGVVWYR